MYRIKCTHDTFLMKSEEIISASNLEKSDPSLVYFVKEGTELNVLAERSINENYYMVTFDRTYGPKKWNTWRVFAPHWDWPQGHLTKVNLPVDFRPINTKFRDQKDNWTAHHGPGWRQCCLTSVSMLLDFWMQGGLDQLAKDQGLVEGEDLYGKVLAQLGIDTTNAPGHPKALARFGLGAQFSNSLSLDELKALLSVTPVPIGVAWSTSGHWMTAIGYDKDGIIAHCPYGYWTSVNNIDTSRSGANQHFPWWMMKHIWVDLGDEAGWGIVPTMWKGQTLNTAGLFD